MSFDQPPSAADPDDTAEYEATPRPADPGSSAGAVRRPWPPEGVIPGHAGEIEDLSAELSAEPVQPPSSNGSHPGAAPPSEVEAPSPAVYEAPPPSPAAGRDALSRPSWTAAMQAADGETAPPSPGNAPGATEPGPSGAPVEQPGSFSFHLDGSDEAAIANGHGPASAPAGTPDGAPPPAPTSAFASAFLTPSPRAEPSTAGDSWKPLGEVSPAPAEPAAAEPLAAPPGTAAGGGRGWSVREARTALPAWAPVSSAPPDDNGGSAPPAPAYSAGTPFFAGAAPGAGGPGAFPWGASARPRPRSSAVRGLFAVLILVILIFAGGFWYFTYGPGAPKAHTVSAPATLGGLGENNTGAIGQVTAEFQSQFAGEPHVKNAVYTFYGDGQTTNGYLLGLFAFDRNVSATDVTNFVKGFNSGASSNFDLSGASTSARAGVTYRCGPVGLTSLSGTLCVWSDVNVIGWVIGLPGESSAATLGAAEEARSSAEH